MDHYKYELTRCWLYAYSQFTDQAHRLSLKSSLAPRAARDMVARLHGFGDWVRLAQTLQDLHDIGCALALDMEPGAGEAAFRNSVFTQVERLASLKTPIRVNDLSRTLRPKYGSVSGVSDLDEEGFSETEYEAWGQYEEIKWEMAYRTLWAREGANSAVVQNIGIELAERLAAWYPTVASDVQTALSIVFDFYGCRAESVGIHSAGPIAEYFQKDQWTPRRVSEILKQAWNEPMPWLHARSLWHDLAYANPSELDGVYDSYPALALLPHAPRDAYIQVHVEKDGNAAAWSETLVRDVAGLAQVAFLGRGSALQVSVVDFALANDVLKAPEKAGWLQVTWNM